MRSPRPANAWRPLARLLWARIVSRRRALNSLAARTIYGLYLWLLFALLASITGAFIERFGWKPACMA